MPSFYIAGRERPLGAVLGGAAGACAAATSFLNRVTSAGLSIDSAHTTAYTNFICGLVTDGVWSAMDVLYVFATNTTAGTNTTLANMNLVSSSFSATIHGSPPFTADNGYTPSSASNFLDTGFNGSTAGGVFSQNGKHVSACLMAYPVISNTGVPIGDSDGTNFVEIFLNNTLSSYYDDNGSAPATQSANSGAALWLGTRTDSTNIRLDRDGSQVGTANVSSVALINNNIYVLARNNNGTSDASISQAGTIIAAASIGGAMSTAQSAAFYSRLNTYMQAIYGSAIP